ncbi:MAG: agmatinase [Omnitrophica bacterium RIFCSPLOWO2_02_FULL_45_16]|nr:MAG: agmatinase [Omnitrophica bacterium RIFCSPHIGHO2_02_FULL_46_20]OGW95108.1 MAG: agmatinase [Omnitrophica bacterium RIFCSPLOWO2_01_FULL_45_24]OGX00065.1 MAG: agmatinase [Omnitrophica bacterium RIFCSPLOWO2_02_FULL_45_16]
MDEKTIITPQGQQASPVAKNYAGIDEEYSSFKKAKVVVLQVPYEKTVTYKKGTVNGPAAIIDASKKMELFDEELNQETFKIGIHTMDPLAVTGLEPEEMISRVYSSTLELLKANKFPVILGGEHSLSVGSVQAFKETMPNISVLHLDAHYDLRNEYFGSKFNHGCVARRISEICPIVQTGTRSLSKEEKDFLGAQTNGSRIKTINVYDILEMPLWKDVISKSLSENVYVSIDLDVFDPSLMPAVGTPEPGGIGWYETLDLLREVSKDKRIVGFDVVELCPIKDQVASDFLAAKLIYRLLGYIFPMKK